MTAVPSTVVRAWARENGYTVSDRGRIPLEIQAAYDAAHLEPQPEQPSPEQPWPVQPGQLPPAPGQQPWPAQGQQPWPAQPGPQQWGPPPGAPQWPPPQGSPQWSPPVDHGRDGFAVAALVLGILPVCVGILGIVFGIIALNRIAGTAKRGRGMAIAGIVCGSLWIVGVVAAVLVDEASQPDRDAQGAVTASGDVGASDLRVGDCAESAPEGTTFTVHLVPCSKAHGAEVFAQFDLEGSGYPGEAEVDRFSAGGCRSRVDAYVGADPTDYELYYLVPTSETWGTGDRQVTCLLGGPDGTTVTGSVRGA